MASELLLFDETDSSEEEVFFGDVSPKEAPLVRKYAGRKTELFFGSSFRRYSPPKLDDSSQEKKPKLEKSNLENAENYGVDLVSKDLKRKIQLKGEKFNSTTTCHTPIKNQNVSTQEKKSVLSIRSQTAKSKEVRRLSKCFNVVKNSSNFRLSPADNHKISLKLSEPSSRTSDSSKFFSTPRSAHVRPTVLTKTPDTLLKSTLKKNYKRALMSNYSCERPLSLYFSKLSTTVEKMDVNDPKTEVQPLSYPIFTNLSSGEETSNSSLSDDGDMGLDLDDVISRTVDKYTPS